MEEKKADDALPQDGEQKATPFGLTRREVLAGTAAFGIAGPAAASTDTPIIDYEDASRRAVIIGKPSTARSGWLRFPASAFADTKSILNRFYIKRIEDGWLAHIDHGSFPGGPSFVVDLKLTVHEEKPGDTQIALTLTGNAFGKLELAGTSIVMPGCGPNDDALLVGKTRDPVAKKLLAVLFPETLEVGSAKDLVLRFHRDASWSATVEAMPIAAMMHRKTGRTIEALDLKVSKIQFFVSDGSSVPGVEQDRQRLIPAKTPDKKPDMGETKKELCPPKQLKVQTLFEGLNVVPTDTASNNAASSDQRILYACADEGTLSGSLRVGSFTPKTEGDDKKPTLFTLKAEGASATSRVIAGWFRSQKNWGFLIGGPLKLQIERPGMVEPLEFASLDGFVARFPNGPLTEIVARLTPCKRIRAKTPYATFHIDALPSYASKPGAKTEVPAIQLGSEGVAGKEFEMTHFAAPLKLETADIGLQASPDAYAALRFDEAECLFYFGDLRRTRPRPLSDVQGAVPPRGEALIDLAVRRAGTLPVRLSLDRAHLSLRRANDVLALEYRFGGLTLEGEANATSDKLDWRVTPNRRVGDFVRDRPRAESPAVPIAECKDKDVRQQPVALNTPRDSRPIMVVDFPPQHIAEQAYPKQILPDPKLPEPVVGKEISASDRTTLAFGNSDKRVEQRKRIADSQAEKVDGSNQEKAAAQDRFLRFVKKFGEAAKTEPNLPPDQQIYIGSAYLDPIAARLARRLARDFDQQDVSDLQNKDLYGDGDVAYRLRGLPDVEINKDTLDELKADNKLAKEFKDINSFETNDDETAYIRAREALKDRQSYEYAKFRVFYYTRKKGLAKEATTPDNAELAEIFLGRETTVALTQKADREKRKDLVAAYTGILDLWQKQTAIDKSDEFSDRPAEARVSGRSRLVFRISANDYDTGEASAEQKPPGSFPFSVEGLTNWGAYDLAVVRRAEKLFEVDENGREPRRWNRVEAIDEGAKLLHIGLTRGDRFAIAKDEGRDCNAVPGRLGTVTAAQRLAEVAASARAAPMWDETSIEFPFRLMLSPAQDATWLTPLTLPRPDLAPNPENPVPLWSTRLEETIGSSSLRGIWSPDFRPDVLVDREIGGPPRGPWAPWALSRDITSRNMADLVARDLTNNAPLERFRGVMDSYDRHELVALTSIHGLPVRGRRHIDGALADTSQFEIPSGFRLRDAAVESLAAGADDIEGAKRVSDFSAIYRPKPLAASELSLSALGASFECDTDFEPPASAKVVPYRFIYVPSRPTKADENAVNLFDAFSIERWRHSAVLGRDIRVEIVYKGFLFPLGIRASFVKLSERRFLRRRVGGAPVAALIQRFFLRIAKPEKRYPTIAQPDGGRRWPIETLELLTRTTPDLLDPSEDRVPPRVIPPSKSHEELDRGRIVLRSDRGGEHPGLVFWPRVAPGLTGDVQFELQIDKRGARVRMPLIFLDNTAANDSETMAALVDYYNNDLGSKNKPLWNASGELSAERRRVMDHHGAKRRYAAEMKPDDTTFETILWEVQAEGVAREQASRGEEEATAYTFSNTKYDFTPILQGANQPPFYPFVNRALVRIAQIDRLVGANASPVTIRFDRQYQAFGFPPDDVLAKPVVGKPPARQATSDVYIGFDDTVPFNPGAAGDRTGGATRPSSDFGALSRSRGPLGVVRTDNAVAPPKMAQTDRSTELNTPSIEKLFNSQAKILGILTFGEAIRIAQASLSTTPAFKEVTEYASSLIADTSSNASEAIAKVRDFLLLPLRDALDTFAAQFESALGNGPSGKEAEKKTEKTLARLYPQVGETYRQLREAVDGAIAESAAATELNALVKRFADIYAAGRRFVEAIERVAHDPISPIKQAVKQAFSTEINTLLGSVESIKQELNGAVLEVVKAAKKEAKSVFTEASLGLWKKLIFALPESPDAADADELRAAVDKALAKALEKTDWIEALDGSVQESGYTPTELAAKRLADSVSDELKDLSPLPLKQAVSRWNSATSRIQGILFRDVMDALSDTLMAADAIQHNLERLDLIETGQRLSQLAHASLKLLVPDFSSIEARATQDICAGAMTALADLVSLVAPRAAEVNVTIGPLDDAAAEATDALQDLIDALNAAGFQDLRDKVETFKKKFTDAATDAAQLVKAVAGAAQSFSSIKADFSASACTKATAEELAAKPFESLNALFVQRRHAIDAFHTLLFLLSVSPFDKAGDLLRDVVGVTTLDEGAKVKTGLSGERKTLADAIQHAVVSLALVASKTAKLTKEFCALKNDVGGEPAQTIQKIKGRLGVIAESVKKAGGAPETIDKRIAGPFEELTKRGAYPALDSAITKLDLIKDDANMNVATFKANIANLKDRSSEARNDLERILTDVVDKLEREIASTLATAIATGDEVRALLRSKSLELLFPAIKLLSGIQDRVVKIRDEIYKKLVAAGDSQGDTSVVGFVQDLGASTLTGLASAFLVKKNVTRKRPDGTTEYPQTGPLDDFLAEEAADLRYLANAQARGLLSASDVELATSIFTDWGAGRASILTLKDQLQKSGQTILSGQLSRLVDLEAIRSKIEAKLKEMVPSRVSLSYDFAAEMGSLKPIFLPKPGSRLTLAAAASYDLLEASMPPQFTATATLEAFDINLFDVVTFKFDGAQFRNDSAKGSNFSVAYNDFELGSKAEFLKPIQSILNPKGSGPYVVPMRGSPGIEAGFSLALGVLSIGTVSFANISINAACRLPFDNKEARFVVSIGRRDKPFLISCLPYTGGGYLALISTSKKMIGFEASFEFGGGGAFKVGPLEGQGRISLGIFVSQIESSEDNGPQGCAIEGFFYAGGEAHIACFSLSAALSVRISQQPGGTMHGSATFSFTFSVGIADIHYQIEFIKTEGKGFSGSKSSSLLSPTRYASNKPSTISGIEKGACLTAETANMATDWKKHRKYFAIDIDGFPQ